MKEFMIGFVSPVVLLSYYSLAYRITSQIFDIDRHSPTRILGFFSFWFLFLFSCLFIYLKFFWSKGN
jgi:hypothetical protein